MVRRTPARPNTASEATTDDASRGGLFTDETDRNVVIDTSSFRGEDGIPGPRGEQGPMGVGGVKSWETTIVVHL